MNDKFVKLIINTLWTRYIPLLDVNKQKKIEG